MLTSILLVSALTLASAEHTDRSAQAQGITDTKSAIRSRARAFSAAYVAGNLSAMMEIYCPNAVLAPPRRNFLEGEDLEAYWTPRPGVVVSNHELETIAIVLHGDVAVDHGFYSGVQRRQGETSTFRGKYLVVWNRTADGSWCMQQDMWNALGQ